MILTATGGYMAMEEARGGIALAEPEEPRLLACYGTL
jgi:hypothetical protein